jgi:hypothetical protein
LSETTVERSAADPDAGDEQRERREQDARLKTRQNEESRYHRGDGALRESELLARRLLDPGVAR